MHPTDSPDSPQSPEAAPPTPPRLVAWLGYGGLLPFAGLALAPWAGLLPREAAGAAMVAYGAVILSFVGALHWAFAMTLTLPSPLKDRLYAWSVVPPLVAWPALLLPLAGAVPLLVAGFVAHYLQDRRLVARAGLPAWYLPLRLQLSAAASLALVSLLAV
jgi:hypothetical protein